jgi:hypothetical protein
MRPSLAAVRAIEATASLKKYPSPTQVPAQSSTPPTS